ncbi:hypothetical protein [Mesorhizobium sp.]|uniref:hypothetical protein n=1 Tax=Mesorhizobium sp. TaxID=1871066 RepID=UPI0025859465|nr:hypothetical protein [Mesorhizobium sp.]
MLVWDSAGEASIANAAATVVVLLAVVIGILLGEWWTEHVGIQAKPAAPDMVPGALVDDRCMLVADPE